MNKKLSNTAFQGMASAGCWDDNGVFYSATADHVCHLMGATIVDDDGSDGSFDPNRTATFSDGSKVQITCSNAYII